MLKHPIGLLNLSKAKENQFAAKGLTTIEDVAAFFPRKYIDFRNITKVADAVVGETCALQGTVVDLRSGNERFMAIVKENAPLPNGIYPHFCVIWFRTNYYISKLEVGKTYTFCGKVSEYRDEVQMVSPIAFSENSADVCQITPIYSKIKGMSNEYLLKQIKAAIGYLQVNERASEKSLFANSLHMVDKFTAYKELHQPSSPDAFKRARNRLAYEDIYDFYDDLKKRDRYLVGVEIQSAQKDAITKDVIASLPFSLTADQESVVNTIMTEIKAGKRVHSMVSGDVGCGKTMVAILSAIFMWENGYQTILMAPTLVLAQQHFKELQSITQPLGVRVASLTTELKASERKKVIKEFTAGNIDILVGTHAVLNDDIVPCKLGMTIIDEEHKFGVKQKAKLEDYDREGVHHLSMTATPIPRSIAMSVYGRDLAVLPIHSMPAGRKPIITRQCFKSSVAFDQIYDEVEAGHQAYIVCPFIDDSDSELFKNVVSVTSAATAAQKHFAKKPNPVRVGVINGDMKQADILAEINKFAAHELDVLVSTTIVEVGVNVPNATIIAIMSADRFGLAALHQLRGRVGRGSQQGYCLLCSPVEMERLNVMCSTTDGFEIALHDMHLRGPGDLMGESQSGDSKIIELIIKRPKLAEIIRHRLFET